MTLPVGSDDRWDVLVARVCEAYGVTADQLSGASRKRPYSTARQMLCYLARERMELTLPEIGTRLGRDHSTVHHAWRAVGHRIAVDLDERHRSAWIASGVDAGAVEADAGRVIQRIEVLATELAVAIGDGVRILSNLDAKARSIHAGIVNPVATRGAA